MKHTPTNEPVATGKHSIGLGAESVALSGIADYGHDPYRPSKHTPSPAEKESVLDAVYNPLDTSPSPMVQTIKMRLEALRDKWKVAISGWKDLENQNVGLSCEPIFGVTAATMEDCADDLQKEIDLLP